MTAGAAGSGNEATQAIEQQIAKLYLQATNTQLSNEQLKELTMVLTGYANREFEREHQRYNDLNWNSGENRCGEVRLFSLGGKIREIPLWSMPLQRPEGYGKSLDNADPPHHE